MEIQRVLFVLTGDKDDMALQIFIINLCIIPCNLEIHRNLSSILYQKIQWKYKGNCYYRKTV